MSNTLSYKTYSQFLAQKFPGAGKIQKIGVSTGKSCPNRDGTIGRGGCAYCNNASFTPGYGDNVSCNDIAATLNAGKAFFARKYPTMKYLAYFQSYTNTYGADIDTLMDMYRAAAAVDDIIGLVIGTRPDCVPDTLLDRLADMNNTTPVMMEYGAESTHDTSLQRVNRCHTWADTVDAVQRTAAHGLSTGLHFIMGLPGETRQMMLTTVQRAVALPIDTIKFHQLQIIRNTRFAAEYTANPAAFDLFTPQRYAELCRDIIDIVAPHDIAIERFVSQSPDDLLIAPRWNLKNYQFAQLLNARQL